MQKEERVKTILVVDDTPMIRTLVRECLEEEYHVRTASNGLEALTVLNEEMPSLILLDLMMPQMDGEAFLEVARQQYAPTMPPIVVMTAYLAQLQDISSQGVRGFLKKPFGMAELLEAVEIHSL